MGGSQREQQVQAETEVPQTTVPSGGPALESQPYGNAAAITQLPGGRSPLLSQIAGHEPEATGKIDLESVPVWVINGILRVEQAGLSPFEGIEEAAKKFLEDATVSLGTAQIQIRRAAELDFPGRDWAANPLTSAEYGSYVSKLEDPTTNVAYLVREMEDNFAFYGRKPGKTDDDRWRFAIARHNGGHGPVGEAQAAALAAGFDANLWEEVVAFLSPQVATFVQNVEGR